MELQLADNVKARQLTSEGTWGRVERAEGGPGGQLPGGASGRGVRGCSRGGAPRKTPQEAPAEPKASVPALASVEKSEVPDAQAAPVSHNGEGAGRVSRALSLFGEGIRTLFGRS